MGRPAGQKREDSTLAIYYKRTTISKPPLQANHYREPLHHSGHSKAVSSYRRTLFLIENKEREKLATVYKLLLPLRLPEAAHSRSGLAKWMLGERSIQTHKLDFGIRKKYEKLDQPHFQPMNSKREERGYILLVSCNKFD